MSHFPICGIVKTIYCLFTVCKSVLTDVKCEKLQGTVFEMYFLNLTFVILSKISL